MRHQDYHIFSLEIRDVLAGLSRKPVAFLAIVVMLTLALGANILAFGLVYGYDLRPLPYHHAGRLVAVREIAPKVGMTAPLVSPRIYHKVETTLGSVQRAGLWESRGAVVDRIDGRPRRIWVAGVTPSFTHALGVRPMLGSGLSAASGQADGPHQGLISWKFWQSAYSGRADAIGRVITVKGVAYRIVGVMPEHFQFQSRVDLYQSMPAPIAGMEQYNINYLMPVLLKPGISIRQFDQQLHGILINLERTMPPAQAAAARAAGLRIDALSMRAALLSGSRIGLMPKLVLASSLFLLVLAVANAANLTLVRQQQQMAQYRLRRVLGGSRLAIVRLVGIEMALIFLASGVLGSMIGYGLLRSLAADGTVFGGTPPTLASGWPVYAFGWGLDFIAVLLIAAIPVAQIYAQPLAGVIGQSARSTLSRAAKRYQRGLTILQVGLVSRY